MTSFLNFFLMVGCLVDWLADLLTFSLFFSQGREVPLKLNLTSTSVKMLQPSVKQLKA